MTNHIHLLLRSRGQPRALHADSVKSLCARRAAACPTTGHLFERRYGAIMVQADAYLLQLVRISISTRSGPLWSRIPLIIHGAAPSSILGLIEVPWLTTAMVMGHLATTSGGRAKLIAIISEDVDPAEAAKFRWGSPDDGESLASAIAPGSIARHANRTGGDSNHDSGRSSRASGCPSNVVTCPSIVASYARNRPDSAEIRRRHAHRDRCAV